MILEISNLKSFENYAFLYITRKLSIIIKNLKPKIGENIYVKSYSVFCLDLN